ncbi:hypothetical protein [Thiolapillus sp.]|uniref:hypothetical protein n=1 Tax=Thiolapillus sp. TaxID=2017437 RepID=UPI003AF9BDEA
MSQNLSRGSDTLVVRGSVDTNKAKAGKHDWAVFLCTDTALSAMEILELYAMRWAIEVYFKGSSVISVGKKAPF